MKYKFDSTFLELGFIKELLKEFNLPNIPVATEDSKLYPGMLYIKDLGIFKYLDNQKFKKIADYYYNRSVFNLTRNMSITTSYYSTDLHEYLGEYLRFIRDYKHLNLMSLYNCFSNRVIFPKNYNENYNYYAIPVKFGQAYTIGLDSTTPIEMYCTLWNNVFIGDDAGLESSDDLVPDDSNLLIKLKLQTKKIVSGSLITDPFIYTKLKDLDATDYLNHWNDLRLIIKVPQTNNTSIAVLEGDYIFDNVVDSKLTSIAMFNFDTEDDNGIKSPYHFKTYPTDLSLLKINDSQKHPFADRLIEYLLDIAITNMDKLEDNIKRTQDYLIYLKYYTPKVIYGVWDSSITDSIYDVALESFITPPATSNPIRYVKKYNNFIVANDTDVTSEGDYNEFVERISTRNLIDVKRDLLMHVDKDIEGLFLATGVDENEYVR